MKKIFITILILIACIGIIVIFKNKKENASTNTNNKQEKVTNMPPEIYYQMANRGKLPLENDNEVFLANVSISWPEGCKGEIKKDGKSFSTTNEIVLTENGEYEITVTSHDGQEKKTKKIVIDKNKQD